MTCIPELQRVFTRSKETAMVFFTKGDVIFRLWLCHPWFAVLKYGFTSASLPETKPNIVNNPG
jgi:hypothetical protein